jgi:hypothetical protein
VYMSPSNPSSFSITSRPSLHHLQESGIMRPKFLYAHMCIYIYIGSWSIFFLFSVYLYEVTNSAEGHTYTLPVLLSSSSFFTCIISIFELLTSTTVIQNGETIHYVVHLSLVPIYVI